IIGIVQREGVGIRRRSVQFCISDQAVSRKHCSLSRENDQTTLIDHDSRNGTFVNGVPINRRQLEHGDYVRIGDHHFIFLYEEDEIASTPAVVQLNDVNLLTGATLILNPDESFYRQPEKLFARLPASNRLARDLNAFLKIGAAINELRKLEALQAR